MRWGGMEEREACNTGGERVREKCEIAHGEGGREGGRGGGREVRGEGRWDCLLHTVYDNRCTC